MLRNIPPFDSACTAGEQRRGGKLRKVQIPPVKCRATGKRQRHRIQWIDPVSAAKRI
jgi:hypothetical protein